MKPATVKRIECERCIMNKREYTRGPMFNITKTLLDSTDLTKKGSQSYWEMANGCGGVRGTFKTYNVLPLYPLLNLTKALIST